MHMYEFFIDLYKELFNFVRAGWRRWRLETDAMIDRARQQMHVE